MPFEPGHKKSKGRPKNSRNKSSLPIREKAQELGIDPFEILLYFAKGDWKALGYESEKIIKYGAQGITNEEFVIEPSIRSKAASEACQYLHPKLKAIDHSISNRNEESFKLNLTLPVNGSEAPND